MISAADAYLRSAGGRELARPACRPASYSGYSVGVVVKVRPAGVRHCRTPGSG
jgi:hypothetical protein